MNQRYVCAGLMGICVFFTRSLLADEPVLPGQGFVASKYEVLWTKSPFSVASSTEAAASPDYSLTGLAQFDGISYASLFDKQKQEHFVLASNKPLNGLTLVSISRAQDPANSSVVIQRNSESITLKLESQPSSAAIPPNGTPMAGPQIMAPPPIPQGPVQAGANPGNPTTLGPAQTPPPPLFHRRIVKVPPPPPSQ